MVSLKFSALLVAVTAVAGVLSSPVAPVANGVEHLSQRSTPNTIGKDDGFYYSFSSDGKGDVTYENGNNGSYSIDWSDAGAFTGGKGQNPGSTEDITYRASFKSKGDAYLGVYGWTEEPLSEYFIVESFSGRNPSSGSRKFGSLYSNGGKYDLYRKKQVDQPSIEGTATFFQYWSVRRNKRTSGTVSVSNHFKAWSKAGFKEGELNIQLLAAVGEQGSGSANVTVS